MHSSPLKMWGSSCLKQQHQTVLATLTAALLTWATVSSAYPRHFINITRGFVSNELKCESHPTDAILPVGPHNLLAVDRYYKLS
jgi:hypothetical protein